MHKTSFSGQIRLGGMGVNISCPKMARILAMMGQIGTVSGVALERVMVYLLQQGDPDGNIRRALATFPFQGVVKKVMDAYYQPAGAKPETFRTAPAFTVKPSEMLIALVICANYAFVWLAKEGHNGTIAINYLEKIAMPHPYAMTGAMLAGVRCFTMGAGIGLQVPAMITDILEGRSVHYDVPILGESRETFRMSFDPAAFFGCGLPEMERPEFVPIISSDGLAKVFCSRRCSGRVDGFAVELWTAAGHKAPPREPVFDELGQPLPIYGIKDEPDFAKIAALGLPFWIGGDQASPEKLATTLAKGAQGIQVGTIFALCDDSGMDPELRRKLRSLAFQHALETVTDMRVSPTGFPFAVALLDGTLSDPHVRASRQRICDHGVLVSLYRDASGNICRRCPAEPERDYIRKGGDEEATRGRLCLCNGLLRTACVNRHTEPPIVTLGNVGFLPQLMTTQDSSYTAADAVRWLLGQRPGAVP